MPALKNYKYKVEIDGVCASGAQCPPINAQEITCLVFRWVNNPISADCFKPQAKRNPSRLHKESDLETRCSLWALSMHKSLDSSIKAFQCVENSFPRARKIFGGWVAEGHLQASHGVCTPADAHGHFDLHEYSTDNSVVTAFSISSSVPEVR